MHKVGLVEAVAIELALLDAECASVGQSLARRFTPVKPGPTQTVPAGVAIGLMDTAGATAAVAATRVAEGYQRIKMKIEPGRDVDMLKNVRAPSDPRGLGSNRIIIDATRPTHIPFPTRLGVPADAMARVKLEEWLDEVKTTRNARGGK